MMPVNQRGVFKLEQTGTLITGTYQLEGNWTGSLQGTRGHYQLVRPVGTRSRA